MPFLFPRGALLAAPQDMIVKFDDRSTVLFPLSIDFIDWQPGIHELKELIGVEVRAVTSRGSVCRKVTIPSSRVIQPAPRSARQLSSRPAQLNSQDSPYPPWRIDPLLSG